LLENRLPQLIVDLAVQRGTGLRLGPKTWDRLIR
jgi:hypothetical protein